MPIYKHARVRGFAPWSPNSRSLKIVDQIKTILVREKAYLPLTMRQIFYRMVTGFGYPKTENAAAGLYEKANRGRRAGLIAWDAIRDDTLGSKGPRGFDDVAGWKWWASYEAETFKLHSRLVQPCRVELHVEAEGMMPQVARAACKLGADVYSSGGFGSVTTQYDSAKRFAERDQPTVVLSIGDFDPSGISLYWSWRENVLRFFSEPERLTEMVGCTETPLFRRIAVTPDQIREHGFPTAPRKKKDNRGDWQGQTVQCEAIPSAMLAQIVRDAVLEHYDERAINEVLALSKTIRAPLSARIRAVNVDDLDAKGDGGLELVRERLHGMDWTSGYENSDEDDMEEGV